MDFHLLRISSFHLLHLDVLHDRPTYTYRTGFFVSGSKITPFILQIKTSNYLYNGTAKLDVTSSLLF